MQRRLAAVFAIDMAGFSRLMERDEDAVLSRQKAHRREVIDPEIATRGGRIVKSTGDGLLAEFATAQDAVRCAVDVQQALALKEAGAGPDERIAYRIGINVGDIVIEDGDIFGDGVNVAARLQGIAEPGGVCISDIVQQTIAERTPFPFRDMGSQRVKNIARPIRVWQWTPDAAAPSAASGEMPRQRIRYVASRDGTQIAWAEIGEGSPLLRSPHYLGHLEYEMQSPVWRPFLTRMAKTVRLVRFDQRGAGMSDWDPQIISQDAMSADMGAVADAAGLRKHALLGLSQGCAFSIRYALERPERVTCLVFVGGYLLGRDRRPGPEQKQLSESLLGMIRAGWGSPNPVFRHFFTSSFIPDASPAVAASFDELQRVATNSENAMRIWAMNADVDVTDLARRLKVPALIFHCVGDRASPLEEGRRLARIIPEASLIELPGDNHILLEGTPAYERFFEETTAFLARHNR